MILNNNCALFRCDQYKWVHKGTRTVMFEDYAIKKKTASIDVKDKEKATGENAFKRLEYWGIESFFWCITLEITLYLYHLSIATARTTPNHL